jgi:transposase
MRGRRLVIAWREDAGTLRELYRQERDAQIRPRLQALWLLREGRPLGEVAHVVGVHYVTAQQWVAWYRRGGLATVRAHRRAGPGRAAWLSAEQRAALAAQAAAGAFHTVADAVCWVADAFGVRYTRWGLYTLLHRLDCRPKVPRPISAKTTAEAQAAWKGGASGRRSPPRA